jgi:hypothetical protein
MATLRDWANPFLEKAKEDLRAARAVYGAGSPSTFCMLLQMTFEKLGKADFARSTKSPQITEPPHSHQTASRLVLLLERAPGGLALKGIETDKDRGRVFAAVRELENAHPDTVNKGVQRGLARWPQLEFPWENPSSGAIEWPAQHLPIARRASDPRERLGADLLKFADALVMQFNMLFP